MSTTPETTIPTPVPDSSTDHHPHAWHRPATPLASIIHRAALDRARHTRKPQAFIISAAAVRLGPVLERLAAVPARCPARVQARDAIAAWHALFQAALPEAPREVHAELTRLCVLEATRARYIGQPREQD